MIEERYGNLFEMYERITDEDPYKVPMRIYPAIHYTMGGLWVDYNLMSNVPGLYVLGEANFSDHGANRLGASALDAGPRRRLLRAPVHDLRLPRAAARHAAGLRPTTPSSRRPRRACTTSTRRLMSINGTHSVDHFHRELGNILWDNCGMARSTESLEKALTDIPALREEFYADVNVLGDHETLNQSLEKAGRVADFLEFGELLCLDALHREECCGGHFRVEHQTEDGEALRDDDDFSLRRRVGVRRASAPRPSSTRSSSSSSTSTSRSAATSDDVRDEARVSMDLNLRVWRQERPDATRARSRTTTSPTSAPRCRSSSCSTCSTTGWSREGREPIAFDHDCREGICGSCSMMINGRAHGPETGTATCQLHMRKFHDGDHITVEPWRARAFPVIRDLVVDRSALDRIVEAGGYITAPTGSAPDANLILVPKEAADAAMDAAACIGCGACVAACPNGAAQLFTAAKVVAPRPAAAGPARALRARRQRWSTRWSASSAPARNHGECEKACPKEISIDFIALLNRDYVKAQFKNRRLAGQLK